MLTIHNTYKIEGMGLMPDLEWRYQFNWTAHPHIWINKIKNDSDKYLIPIWRAENAGTPIQIGLIRILRRRPEWEINWNNHHLKEHYQPEDIQLENILKTIKFIWESDRVFSDPFSNYYTKGIVGLT